MRINEQSASTIRHAFTVTSFAIFFRAECLSVRAAQPRQGEFVRISWLISIRSAGRLLVVQLERLRPIAVCFGGAVLRHRLNVILLLILLQTAILLNPEP